MKFLITSNVGNSTFLFLMFQYPDLDVQTLFIGRVQYIQGHAIYALWLSYGLILGLSWLDSKMPGNSKADSRMPGNRRADSRTARSRPPDAAAASAGMAPYSNSRTMFGWSSCATFRTSRRKRR